LDPSYVPALWRIADAYEQLGKYEDALAFARKYQETTSNRSIGLRPLARIYASMGRRREAMEAVRVIEDTGTLGGNEYALAVVYSALGDRDRAITQLEKGMQMRSLLAYVFVEPQLDALRNDPRFQQLRRRAGLSP
jgi:tetratricopeptide (TPR) repeat protein